MEEAKVMSKEEFDRIVVKPIRAAYRDQTFLPKALEESEEYTYWYETLKTANKIELERRVEVWVRRNKEMPVLADLACGLEL